VSAHTPGPWPRCYVAGAIRHLVRNVDRDAFVSDEELTEAGQPDFSWAKYDDADLITAAPDLLDACETALATCSPFAAEKIRAAIAKAEGSR
jgi:hypothetical protein